MPVRLTFLGAAGTVSASRYLLDTGDKRVLIDSGIPEEHWSLLRADMGRQLNMARDAGRPSDAMRSAVRAFKVGQLTDESFTAARPSGYYPEG